MKRTGAALLLAVALHVLLFSVGINRAHPSGRAENVVLTMSLARMPLKNSESETVTRPVTRPPPVPAPVHRAVIARRKPADNPPLKRSPPDSITERLPPSPEVLPRQPANGAASKAPEPAPITAPAAPPPPAREYDAGENTPRPVDETGAGQAVHAGPADSGTKAFYLRTPPPVYPLMARKRRLEGTVIFTVLVDKKGRVAEIRIEQSSGHGVLDRAAEKAVRNWIFEPAAAGGRAVASWVMIPVRFKLK